jgi:hypothetical protein
VNEILNGESAFAWDRGSRCFVVGVADKDFPIGKNTIDYDLDKEKYMFIDLIRY